MVKSMTGYGGARGTAEGTEFSVELKSVNNRYLDCNVRLPRAYSFAEESIKAAVSAATTRGKVDVFVTLDRSSETDSIVKVNESLAQSYLEAFAFLEKTYSLKNDITAATLGRLPDVLQVEKKEADQELVKAGLLAALAEALAEFNAMRLREGEKLAEDVLHRADTIEALVGKVEARSPETVREYRTKLENRMKEILQDKNIEEARLLTEAAIFADKVAVDEETVRLRSHLAQLRGMFSGDAPVGRKLDFLVQEMNREANTIGSKCTDTEIAYVVVDIKAEIEKIREQIQNIE